MNVKKAKLKRQINREILFIARERWLASEPPRWRFIKWRKWRDAEPVGIKKD